MVWESRYQNLRITAAAKVMAKEKAQRSNLGALALCLDVLPPAPPVTALITLCKPVTMADNWSNKQEGGHASHRRRPAIWSIGGALAENARDWIGVLIGGNWAFLARWTRSGCYANLAY